MFLNYHFLYRVPLKKNAKFLHQFHKKLSEASSYGLSFLLVTWWFWKFLNYRKLNGTTTLSMTTFNIRTLIIIIFSIQYWYAECHYAESLLCSVLQICILRWVSLCWVSWRLLDIITFSFTFFTISSWCIITFQRCPLLALIGKSVVLNFQFQFFLFSAAHRGGRLWPGGQVRFHKHFMLVTYGHTKISVCF
jgi:hypothetical protein